MVVNWIAAGLPPSLFELWRTRKSLAMTLLIVDPVHVYAPHFMIGMFLDR